MKSIQSIFLDPDLRRGGYFELAIQVSMAHETDTIRRYKDFIWSLENVEGPFSPDMLPVAADLEAFSEEGVVAIGSVKLPFKLHFIREEPLEIGFNWLCFSFYVGTLNAVFSLNHLTFEGAGELPAEVNQFFDFLMRSLNSVEPFFLAMKDFEISGEYYLQDLSRPGLENWTSSHFFVPAIHWDQILEDYHSVSTRL